MGVMSDQPIRLFAPAKLTTSLRVVGTRADGYHLIDAEMVTLDVGDTLELTESDSTSVTYVGLEGDRLDVGENDLVARALGLCRRSAHVRVTKAIAAGAGLGGGSSDAAAVLYWAGMTDLGQAVTLGADVAFCLHGGRANVRGIGEVVEPLPFEEKVFTLMTPPIMCSTPLVYRAWDELGAPRGDNGNDLEPAALVVAPELARWRDELAETCSQRPRLAGSGSTWFVEGAFPGEGRVVTRTIPGRPPITS